MSVSLENPPRNFREVALILHQIVNDVEEIKQKQVSNGKLVAGALISFGTGVVTPLVVSALTR